MPDLPAITATSLSKTYVVPWTRRRVDALRDVSLEVPAGSTFGLLGPNGAGKTTFVKILLGMTQPTAGSARLLGARVDDFRARRRVGYLPEGGRFPVYHTGESLLVFHGQLAGLQGSALQSRVDELLELVSMSQWKKVRLSRYSKGMVQRIGLAQAMLNEPDLLMLDEPTDGVDPVGRAEIREILDRLNSKGVTVFLNSHILAEVALFCRQVAILHRGMLQVQGDVASLTRKTGYRLSWRESGAEAAASPAQEEFPDIPALNQAIDRLRGRGDLVVGVERCQSSLEQVFLRAVNGRSAIESQLGDASPVTTEALRETDA